MKSRTSAPHRALRDRSRVAMASNAVALAAIVIGTASGAAAQPANQKLSEFELIVQHNVSNRTRACEELASLELRDTTIASATSITGGTFTPSGATAALTGLPDFCRVVGTVYPTINFEVWLPVAKSWNGKFAASGSGGTGGFINYGQLASVQDGMSFNLKRGYVAAATDQGHTLASFTWLLDPGRLAGRGLRPVRHAPRQLPVRERCGGDGRRIGRGRRADVARRRSRGRGRVRRRRLWVGGRRRRSVRPRRGRRGRRVLGRRCRGRVGCRGRSRRVGSRGWVGRRIRGRGRRRRVGGRSRRRIRRRRRIRGWGRRRIGRRDRTRRVRRRRRIRRSRGRRPAHGLRGRGSRRAGTRGRGRRRAGGKRPTGHAADRNEDENDRHQRPPNGGRSHVRHRASSPRPSTSPSAAVDLQRGYRPVASLAIDATLPPRAPEGKPEPTNPRPRGRTSNGRSRCRTGPSARRTVRGGGPITRRT